MEKIFETTFQLVLAVIVLLCVVTLVAMGVFVWKVAPFVSVVFGLLAGMCLIIMVRCWEEWKEARL